MKLVMGRNELLKGVQSVIGAVSRKNNLPILDFLHVTSDGETMTLTATDLETTLISRLMQPSDPFTTLLPARRLYDVLRAFPDGATVGLEEKDGKTTIKCGRSRFVLSTLDANDFPLLTDDEPDYEVTLDQALLKSLLGTVDYATALKDVRYYLNGVLVEMSDTFTVVGTDGHRLACAFAEVGLPTDRENVVQVILPSDAVRELQRLLNDEEECEIGFTQDRFRVDMENTTFITKLIAGKYPDYQRVIPKETPLVIRVSREALMDALNRVRLVLDKQDGIECVFTENTLTLKANCNTEDAEEVMDVDYSGETFRIGFNHKYLLEMLKVMESENVLLKFVDAQSSMLVKGVEQEDGLHVVMPVRL